MWQPKRSSHGNNLLTGEASLFGFHGPQHAANREAEWIPIGSPARI